MKKLILIVLISIGIFGCSRSPKVIFHTFANAHWDKNDSIQIPIKIDESGIYDLSILLRQNNDYPFSNIWVSMKMEGPGIETKKTQYNLTLADLSGRWLGQGPGNTIDNRFLILNNLQLKQAGIYTFTLKQNMREDDLKGIMMVGIRVKKLR